MSIQALKEERAGLVAQMRGILDAAEKESRVLSAEEKAKYDAIEADVDDRLGKAIADWEADSARKAKLSDFEAKLKQSAGAKTNATSTNPAAPISAKGSDGSALAMEGFRHCLINGFSNIPSRYQAALQADVEAQAGFLVAPEQFMADLIQFVNNMVFIRGIATVLPLTSAESLGAPSLENDPADADWTAELAIGGEDSTMSVGKRRLTPHPLAKLIKVSKTLLRKSAIPVENLVRERLGYKFGVSEEKAFLTGGGSNQPLGVFTASGQGISTGRDVSTGNLDTAVTADGLINAKFALKSQYMNSPKCRWVFNRTVIRDIRKLKDGNGQYIWTAGLGSTKPDTILECPYAMSEYAPNTMTTGQYVGIIGDFSYYWIAESLRMEMQRLDELYAATNQVGFIGRQELDGMPVLEEAFVRVKLA